MIDFKEKKLITIKIGSNILTDSNNKLDLNNLRHLISQIVFLKEQGKQIVIVTSGAIVCGAEALGIRPESLTDKQAAAAVGQVILMENYQNFFIRKGFRTGQILLTKDTFEDEERALLAANTFMSLIDFNVIPIVNENDTIAVDEIKFSDNDNLSAMVSKLIKADLQIILTDIDGLYNCDPRTNPDAKLIADLDIVSTELLESLSSDSPSQKGRGGMKSKITAAEMLMAEGIDVIIANGRRENILIDLFKGQGIATVCKGAI